MAEKHQVETDREAAIRRGREGRAAAQNPNRQTAATPTRIPPPPGARATRTNESSARDGPAGDIVRALPGADLIKKAKKLLSGSN